VVTGDVERFLEAARRVGVSRRRTGATSWTLYQDAADGSVYVEMFVVPTWGEHLRMRAFTDGPSAIRHLLLAEG